jgi:hypothetical protein
MFILCAVLYAIQLQAFDWSSKGITIVEKGEKDGKTELILKDEKENPFSLSYTTEPHDAMLQSVVKLNSDFRSWKSLKIDSIKFFFEQGGLEISIMPKSFTYDGKDLSGFMPSGMQFTYSYLLQYNFRINIDRLFVRIAGDFESEDALCKKIMTAIENPKEYIKKREPEYLLTKLEAIEMKYQRLSDEFYKLRAASLMLHNSGFFSGPAPIDKQLIDRVVDMRLKDPSISREKIAETLEKDKIKASGREIDLILKVYFNDFK